MLRINVCKSAASAKKYYSEESCYEKDSLGAYYSEKGKIIGAWGGKGVKMLGLSKEVFKKEFDALCDNIHPKTRERLTGRYNASRRVGYDFTFNASKSVSLAYVFADEKGKAEILAAFKASVKEAMIEVESGMQTRVRSGGQDRDRETNNIIYGEFTQFTSRPVKGIADPHLHSHCLVFNSTFDGIENKWKAGQFGQIKKDAPYYEAIFHSAFADKLKGLGYEVKKGKVGFELAGVDRNLTEKFSNRTREIEKLAFEKNITDAKQKSEIGARTRESKKSSLSNIEEFAVWKSRLSEGELASFNSLKKPVGVNDNFNAGAAKNAVEFSLAHHLERKSVTTDKEVLTLAIKDSLGAASWQSVKNSLKDNEGVISVKEDGVNYMTTHQALQEENRLIATAHDFKGRFKPLNKEYKPKADFLNGEQLKAIDSALSSSDGISIIAGKAGTGKTTLMKEVQQGIVEGGKEIFAFAPSAAASRGVQRSEGFANAETIAALLQNKKLQDKVKGGVIWIDEAGMVGVHDMNEILSIAKSQKARLILSGDVRQHSSVERGDALRILQNEAGIAPIHVSKIQRQKNKEYRKAVEWLSQGEVMKGFNKLDKMGAVKEIEDGNERISAIAKDYFESVYGGNVNRKKPASVLVVSPTHKEGDWVTAAIRQKLQAENVLDKKEKQFLTLKNTQLTQAQMAKPEYYAVGNHVEFHQNVKGFKAGGKFEIVSSDEKRVFVKGETGEKKPLPLDKAKHFKVYESKEQAIAKGDKIRITGNGKTMGNTHLFNGTVFNVEGFDKSGNIKLSNGSVISKDYRHWGLGYVNTSIGSQGKTVDRVIISQSSETRRAANMQQLYVSASRGRKSVAIYTDNKQDFLKAVSQTNERKSARELVGEANKGIAKDTVIVDLQRKHLMERMRQKAYAAYGKMKTTINKGLNYELPRKISRAK